MTAQSRKERDRRRRKEDFLLAAERLFAEKGYQQTSIEDIARTAEYSVGTVYRYFESKEDLYTALMASKVQDYFVFLKEKLEAAPTALECFRALTRGKIEFVERDKEFFRLYARELATPFSPVPAALQARLAGTIQEFKTYMREKLRACMVAGGIREMEEDKLLSAFHGLTNNLLLDVLRGDIEATGEDLERFILDLLENGVVWRD